jgi:hypothetical protein
MTCTVSLSRISRVMPARPSDGSYPSLSSFSILMKEVFIWQGSRRGAGPATSRVA